VLEPHVEDVRELFARKFEHNEFVIDKTGVRLVEVVGRSFVADEDHIFGLPNESYVRRELEWYESMSLSVDDIPGGPPKIWKEASSKDGRSLINSNYGYLIYSMENYEQYRHVFKELKRSRTSRRAVMIYQRPSMWYDYNRDGRSDFICTNAVSYLIRDGALDAVVQMRSNDAWAGYRNDHAWQRHVLEKLAQDLDVDVGVIHWNAASLHLYEHQFYLLRHYVETGEDAITKARYVELYGDDSWASNAS